MEEKLYDINEACRMLNTTSRTLRFYEEKGIVKSTKVQFSIRRHYTKEQIDHIRNIIVLRNLGLSVKEISDLQSNDKDLMNTMLEKRAEIYAYIEKKNKELMVITEAIEKIESGKSIYEKEKKDVNKEKEKENIVKLCSSLFVDNKISELYELFIPKMTEFRPISSFEAVRKDVLKPLGSFVSYGNIEVDSSYENIYYHFLKYEKMNLKIKYVFLNDKIGGFWLTYSELK